MVGRVISLVGKAFWVDITELEVVRSGDWIIFLGAGLTRWANRYPFLSFFFFSRLS
jgi:hypothetical protein